MNAAPQLLALNSNSSRLAVVDVNGVFSPIEVNNPPRPRGVRTGTHSQAADGFMKISRIGEGGTWRLRRWLWNVYVVSRRARAKVTGTRMKTRRTRRTSCPRPSSARTCGTSSGPRTTPTPSPSWRRHGCTWPTHVMWQEHAPCMAFAPSHPACTAYPCADMCTSSRSRTKRMQVPAPLPPPACPCTPCPRASLCSPPATSPSSRTCR